MLHGSDSLHNDEQSPGERALIRRARGASRGNGRARPTRGKPRAALSLPRGIPGLSDESELSRNPLMAIGSIMTDVARGLKGKAPLTAKRIREERLDEEDREIRRFNVGMKALRTFADVTKNASSAEIKKAGDFFNQRFGKIAGMDFTKLGLNRTVDLRGIVKSLEGIDPTLLIGMRPRELQELSKNTSELKILEKATDRRNISPIMKQFRRVSEAMKGRMSPEQFKEVQNQEFPLRDLVNLMGNSGLEFNTFQLGTIQRKDKEIVASLRSMGFNVLAVGDKSLSRQKAEAVARQAPSSVSRLTRELQDARESGNEELATNLEAELRQETAIVGRTPEDVAATRKAKDTAAIEVEENQAISTAVANLAGVSTSMTVKEARAAGISIPRSVAVEKLQGRKAASLSMIRLSKKTQSIIRGRPEILSAPGATFGAINSLRSIAIGFARGLGLEAKVQGQKANFEALGDVGLYADTLKELAIENARVQSNVVGLAFAAAAAAGSTGRAVSDKDVERWIKRIGKNADPDAFVRVLDDLIAEIDARFRDEVRVSIGVTPKSLIQERDEIILQMPLNEITKDMARELTPEAFLELKARFLEAKSRRKEIEGPE